MDGVSLLSVASEAGLTVRADGDKIVIRGPRTAGSIAQQLLAQKAEVMAVLQQSPRGKVVTAVCCQRCRSREYQDFPIHGGQSVRRDCAQCGRFLDFPVWYGQARGGHGER